MNDDELRRPAIKVRDVTGLQISGNKFTGFHTAIDAERIVDADIRENDVSAPSQPRESRTAAIRKWLLGGVSMAVITKLIGLS